MFVVGETQKRFIESEVAIVVGTRDADLVPELTGGWGPRVLERGTEVELFIDTPRAGRTLENLRGNGLIAVTFASPITYLSLQLKGWCTDIGEPAPEDEQWLDRHRQMLTEALRARREPAHVTRNYWTKKSTRLRFQVDAAYDQTPEPGAGGKL